MKRLKKLFEVQENLRSYKYSLTKIAVCLLIQGGIFLCGRHFHLASPWEDIVDTAAIFVFLAAFSCLSCSVWEMLITHDRLHQKGKRTKKALTPLQIVLKLFYMQYDLTSYKFSLIKISVCVGGVLLITFRNRIFHFTGVWITVDKIVSLVLALASVSCFLPSFFELFATHENRHRNDRRSKNAKLLPMEVIQKIVQENDLVEIEVGENGQKCILIGASAECTRDGDFEEKRFYIQDTEYQTIEEFSKALLAQYPKRWVPVSKIDGIRVDKTPYGKRAREM